MQSSKNTQYSSGYINNLVILSFISTLFTVENNVYDKKVVQGNLLLLDDQPELVVKYKEDFIKRLNEFLYSDRHKGLIKKVLPKVNSFLHKNMSRLEKESDLNLSLLCLYMLKKIVDNEKTAPEIKNLIKVNDILFMYDMIKKRLGLMQTIKHKRIADKCFL